MSPRAAWRLTALGHREVYDYTLGKADWLAAGLPTEGRGPRRPRVSAAMETSVPTCAPGELVADAARRLAGSPHPAWVVVDGGGVVQGRLRPDRLTAGDPRDVGEAMEPGPATVRADADLGETVRRMSDRRAPSLIVSDPDGVLLGLLVPGPRVNAALEQG